NLLQKQQSRWLLAGMVVSWTLFYSTSLYITVGGDYSGVMQGIGAALGHILGLVAPLFITIAMLRYRLYDADYALNRSLVFSTVTLVLATFFTALVVVLRLFLPNNENSTLVLVIAAMCVGAVFAPA